MIYFRLINKFIFCAIAHNYVQTYNPRHSDCIYYSNGYCKLHNMKIDPSSPICPYFTPKKENYTPSAYQDPYVFWNPYFMSLSFNPLLMYYYMLLPIHLMFNPYFYMLFNPFQWIYPMFFYPMPFYPFMPYFMPFY